VNVFNKALPLLYSKFLAAGLARPRCGCTRSSVARRLDADRTVVLTADIERPGVVTASELGAETLVERIIREMVENQSVIVGRAEIGAWSLV